MSFNFENPSKIFAWFYSIFCPFYGRKFYKMLLKELTLNGNESILDFGSGSGVLAKKISKKLSHDGHLTCLDVSEAFLNKVRRKLRKSTNINYILGDMREKNIPIDSFDIILITWVIHHLENDHRFELIQQVVNTLKAGGKIYVIEYISTPHGIREEILIELFHKMSFSERLVNKRKNTCLYEFKRE